MILVRPSLATAALVAGLVCLAAAPHAQSLEPVAVCTGGQVRGARVGSGTVFKGIPYAAPPLGALRWREPQPVPPWSGVRDATAFAAPCAQLARFAGSGRHESIAQASKEDCLFLNVWTPEWPVKSRRPVLVSIHGGGHVGNAPIDDLGDLARRGLVVVSVQYRLGQLGFFAHPELTRESPHRGSGNYALLDQIAALRWVRGNIGRFGGDPGSVTVEGHSSGALDISLLMTSPLAKGLFHRAIIRSGVTLSAVRTLAEAERDGEALAASLKAASLAHLRDLPVGEILNASPNWTPGRYPAVDGYVLLASRATVFGSGQQHGVPMMIGSAARDYPTARRPTPPDPDELRQTFGPLAERAIALYNSATSSADPIESPGEQWAADGSFRCGAVQQASWHAQAGHRVFQYQFSLIAAPGNAHGVETPYLFGTLAPASADVDRTVSATLQKYFTNFAKTGDPNDGVLPRWPEFDPKARAYLDFTDRGAIAGEGLRRAYCDVHLENATR